MISFKELINSFDEFFFKPQSTDTVALFRIAWGILLFANFLTYLPNVDDFYGPHAITSFETVKSQFSFLHMNIFYLFPMNYSIVYSMLILYGLSLVGVIFGIFTRTSLVMSCVLLMSFHHRNIWLLSGSELIMRLVSLYLVFAPCGNSLSIDSLLGKRFADFRKEPKAAPWAMRLIQIQISVIYVWTVWNKLKGDLWFDGTAVYYATRLENFYNYPAGFLLDSKIVLMLMTWGTLITELALGTLIWFKEFRKPLIIIGIIFHIGIDYTMSIPFFEYVMIALLLLYLTPAEVRHFVNKIQEAWRFILDKSPKVAQLKEKKYKQQEVNMKKYILNSLIVFYLGVIYFSGAPDSNTFNARLKQKANSVAFAVGISPSWSMFAPNPIRFDSKTYVEIVHADGKTQEYDVEVELDGTMAAFRKARWMKYSQDNLRSPRQQLIRQPALRYFVNKYQDEKNPIALVTIKRKWWEVEKFSDRGVLRPVRSAGVRPEKTEILLTQKYGK